MEDKVSHQGQREAKLPWQLGRNEHQVFKQGVFAPGHGFTHHASIQKHISAHGGQFIPEERHGH